MDSDEDLNQYRILHESPTHWRLRKMFIQEHRKSLPDDELRCLSQVLLNIEFLGCVYPQETMRRVEALASDILKKFRQSSQGSNKRTLVSAQETTANKYRKLDDGSAISTSMSKKMNINFVKATEEIEETGSAEHRKFRKLLKNVVLFKVTDEAGEVVYNNSMRKTIDQNRQAQWSESCVQTTFSCSLDGVQLVKVEAQSQKKAKAAGNEKLYKLLQNYCHLLVKKAKFFGGDVEKVEKPGGQIIVDKPQVKKNTIETYEEHKLGQNNIGFRMLKALGWKEGDNQKGIVDPIGLSVKIGRAGLGSEPKKGKKLNISYFRQLMINFRDSGSDFDLIFSSEFAKEERAELHKLAQRLGLKSKSDGKDDDRYLTVRRKTGLTPLEIVQRIQDGDPFYSAIWSLESPLLQDYETLDL
ncbi:NF-kappa-B-repressing factor-like [Culicoides brevitarsis]|uniref:NF-kappa-B-repressing factor-like n=1 Tax=Culicoides brevitarsis TaxID=469753 RepID=UPI00307CA387